MSAGAAKEEVAFRDGLVPLVEQWRQRLRSPSTVAKEMVAIGLEVRALRSFAHGRGWSDLARALESVERAAAQSFEAFAHALQALTAILPQTSRLAGAPPLAGGFTPAPGTQTAQMTPSPRPREPSPAPGGPEAARASAQPARDPRPAGAPGPAPRPVLADTIEGRVPPLPARPTVDLGALASNAARVALDPAPRPPEHGRVLGVSELAKPLAQRTPHPVLDPSASARARALAATPWGSGAEKRRNPPPRQTPRVPAWVYAAGATVLLGAAMVGVVIVFGRKKEPPPDASAPDASATASDSASTAAVDRGEVVGFAKRAQQLGPETPELRALLDMQMHLVVKCRDDSSKCLGRWTPYSRESLELADAGAIVSTSADGPLPYWMQKLKQPRDFPALRDEPSLKGIFEYNTKNIAGRQHFQSKLFACGAYADIFEATVEKYGAPHWLIAVVYQESGCEPLATSGVGARGLWQFMPESGRAFGLRVIENEIDERLDPVKATDAAIHFLTDLHRYLGSWDLCLAAYNMGPFALAQIKAKVGGNPGFWDLVHAGLLPDETSGYVPAIEADALVLENLSRLQFSRDGKRLESTAELVVKPGTRLSLVARAAHTSTLRIRELNPAFLRDVVPEGQTTAYVPDAEAHRAQVFLETLPPGDNRDTCVPEDFDWGAKSFDTSKFAAGCADGGAAVSRDR